MTELPQELIDDVLPTEEHVRSAIAFLESCPYSTTALLAFIAAVKQQGQDAEAGLLQAVVEEFAIQEVG